jgi:multidrug efflux pump subunit AcrB
MPQAADQQLNASIIVQTRLQTPEEFGKILLKVQQDGSQVLLRDVARVELGAEDYSTVARYNGKPAAGIAIKLATGANALDTSRAVKELNRLSAYFPASLKTVYPYDTTPFIEISIQEVLKHWLRLSSSSSWSCICFCRISVPQSSRQLPYRWLFSGRLRSCRLSVSPSTR